jgi:MFS family permease
MFSTFKKPALVKIYIIPLLTVMAGSMTWSVSILYALDLGADILQVNLISTISSTMGIFLLVPFGILSDRFGRRPMVLYSRIIIILGTLVRVVATEANHLLLASFIGGFAGGGFFPILLSMIGDIATPEEQREAISTLYLFSSFGMLGGPIITSFLLSLFQMTLRNIYQIVLIAQTIVLIYLTTQIRETKPKTSTPETKYRTHIADLLHQTGFQAILIMAILYFFSRSIINTYIPIHGRIYLNLSNAEVASFSTYRNLAIMLIRLSSATLLQRVPIRPILFITLILGGVSSFASTYANNYLTIVAILFTSGLSYGAFAILGNFLVARYSTPVNRGVANSLYNIAQSTGNITNVFTSSIADTLGLTPIFIVGGISAITSIIPLLMSDRSKDKNPS